MVIFRALEQQFSAERLYSLVPPSQTLLGEWRPDDADRTCYAREGMVNTFATADRPSSATMEDL